MAESKEREPHYINLTHRASSEPYIRDAARTVGLLVTHYFTDSAVAAAVYGAEGVRIGGNASKWYVYEQAARQKVERGGALFRLVANPPEAGIAPEQIEAFIQARAEHDPEWGRGGL